jgi:cell division septation protein DedD
MAARSYHFEFTWKRMVILSVVLFGAGVLTFAGGVVTGIGIGRGSQPAEPAATVSAGTPAAPRGPAVAAPAVRGPSLTGPTVTGPSVSSAGVSGGSATAPTATGPTVSGAAVAAPSAAAAAQAAAAARPAPKDGAAAEAPTDGAAHRVVIPGPSPYCLQIGSFASMDEARKLQTELKDKGYEAVIFDQIDSERRTWHAVRIGAYPTLQAASEAAAQFSDKVRKQALVRRTNSL